MPLSANSFAARQTPQLARELPVQTSINSLFGQYLTPAAGRPDYAKVRLTNSIIRVKADTFRLAFMAVQFGRGVQSPGLRQRTSPTDNSLLDLFCAGEGTCRSAALYFVA